MARKHTPNLSRTNEVMSYIIDEIICRRVLDNADLIPAKAYSIAYKVEQKAKAFGITLTQDTLYNTLFEPYSNKADTHLSLEYFDRLYDYLTQFANKTKKLNAKDLEQLDKFKSLKSSHFTSVKKSAPSNKPLLTKDPNQSNILKHLIDTTWNFYERIGDEDIRNAKWGIAIGELRFFIHPTMKVLFAELRFKIGNAERMYKGKVHSDGSAHIYLELELENKRAYVTIRTADTDYEHQSLLLGHFMYFSKFYRHVLSKAIIVEKHVKQINLTPVGEHHCESDDYKKIDENIKWYLYNRDANRLSMPKSVISNMSDLNDFITNRQNDDPAIGALQHLYGKYIIFYKLITGDIFHDEFELKIDSGNEFTIGVYTHFPDANKRNNKTWRGRAYLNGAVDSRVLVLELSEIPNKKREREIQEDPILLTLNLPNDELNFDDCECYSGMLTGLQDKNRSPVSYLCLATPERAGIKGSDDPRIIKYFSQNLQFSLAPITKTFKLN